MNAQMYVMQEGISLRKKEKNKVLMSPMVLLHRRRGRP